MAFVPAKCTQCGGQIEVDDTKDAGICKHCGMAYVTEKVIHNHTTIHNVTNNITKIINGNEKDDGETHFQRGLTNLKLKKYDAARKNFDAAIRENPEISRYYFYWCLAESEHFSSLNIFLGYNNYLYQLDDDGEDTHSIESFFALTTKEECDALTQEYGVELTNGFEGLVEWCITQFLQGVNPNAHYNFYNVWSSTLNKLNKDASAYDKLVTYGSYYLVKVVADVYDRVIEDNSCQYIDNSKRDTIYFMINYMLENDIYPLEISQKKSSSYVETVKLAMDLAMYYLEDTISGLENETLKASELESDAKEILTSFYKGRVIYEKAVKKENKSNGKGFISKLFNKNKKA